MLLTNAVIRSDDSMELTMMVIATVMVSMMTPTRTMMNMKPPRGSTQDHVHRYLIHSTLVAIQFYLC